MLELPNDWWQPVDADGREGPHADGAGVHAVDVCGGLLEPVLGVDDGLNQGQDGLAVWGQLDAGPVTDEEGKAEFLLQLVDRVADR